MLNPDSIRRFRARLAKQIALTEVARVWGVGGPYALAHRQREQLARDLGLDMAILDEAARLNRASHGALANERSADEGTAVRPTWQRTFDLPVRVPEEVARPMAALAASLKLTTISRVTLSLCHAAMQTTREPTPRSRETLGPLPGCEAARERLTKAFDALPKKPPVTPSHRARLRSRWGLQAALEARAAAYGLERPSYIVLWCADLVDGLLTDLPLAPISWRQTFDTPRAYVLPVVPEP